MRTMPSWSARRRARPPRRTEGWPVGRRTISISRQPTPRTPSPSTLLMASLAAQRPAEGSGRCRTEAASAGVRTRLEKRDPKRSRVARMRSTLMMSMPSSVVPSGTAGTPATALLDGDGLGEVARLVDVGTAGHRRVVGEQLQRDHGEDRAERLDRLGHPQDVVGVGPHRLVALGGHGDDPRVAGAPLHDVADQLLLERRAGGPGDDGQPALRQRAGAVLQLARRVALSMDVADLLELERTLQSDRVADAPTDEHEATRVDVAAGPGRWAGPHPPAP